MTRHHLHRQGFAAVATLALGLSALGAAPAHALATFGAYSSVAGAGFSLDDGGAGSFAASRAYSIMGSGGGVTGHAAADLAGGKLHASSLATRVACQVACDFVGVTSRAAMWDAVAFYQKDGSPMESMALIPTSLEIDGVLSGHGARAWVRSYYGYDANIDVDTLQWTELTEQKTEILDNLFVPLTTAPMFIYVELWTSAKTDGKFTTFARSDFGNTLHFNWELPEGIVAQSASGLFMTDLGSPVPEPATWALMIAGFALTGGMLRRRNAAPAAA